MIEMLELPQPKPKKNCKLPQNLPLPVIFKKDGTLKKIIGYFNGFSVNVIDPEDMKNIISMGYFGKATFSRSYPQFARSNQVKIIRQRQFENRKICVQKLANKSKPEKVILVPDSDSENEDYLTNLQPKYEIDYSGLKENLWLTLYEAFFLSSAVKCLDVIYNDEKLDNEKLWNMFEKVEPNFVRNYVVYFYYRGKNWVVKPGIKFGGDFMLYKQGPPFYHATYVVIIEVVDEDGNTIKSLTNYSMDNLSIQCLNRLCETAGKELILCRVTWPATNQISYEDFTNVKIQEIWVSRWNPSQEREDTS